MINPQAGHRLRVALLFQRFGPYHVARTGALREVVASLQAIELSNTDSTYQWESPEVHEQRGWITIGTQSSYAERWGKLEHDRLINVLSRFEPDVVAIPGWVSTGALCALQWAVENRVPSVIMSESAGTEFRSSTMRNLIKKYLVKCCGGALVGGSVHRRYLARLGMPEERIFSGYDVVDNAHFARGAQLARDRDSHFRRLHGVPGRYFLTVSRFVEKKNIGRLLDAYALYRQSTPSDPWSLVVAGDGPLRAELKHHTKRLAIDRDVHFVGFQQYEDLPVYYGLAGCFVLASVSEQWGLVVNEAMASGLPVLVSRQCGCVAELVRDGENGFTFDPHDPENLADRMAEVSSPSCDREAMAHSSRKVIADWGPVAFADGLVRASRASINAMAPVPLASRVAVELAGSQLASRLRPSAGTNA